MPISQRHPILDGRVDIWLDDDTAPRSSLCYRSPNMKLMDHFEADNAIRALLADPHDISPAELAQMLSDHAVELGVT
jgi:hypothetical protein